MAFELPKIPKPSEQASSPSLRELSKELQKKIDLSRSSRSNSPHSPTLATVPEPAQYTSRTLSNPVAAVEICPGHPDYMIVGTYALLNSDEPRVSTGQVRTGSISVVPLAAVFKPAYPGATPPVLDEKYLNAAVLDIHFHPSDDTLLGVATSDAKMTFFRLSKRADVLARRIEMHLGYLGSVSVAEPNEHREIPLVTSFCWLPGLITGIAGSDKYYQLSFAVTISDGDVKIVRAATPSKALGDSNSSHLHGDSRVLESKNLGKHSEEAWTVVSTIIPRPKSSSDGVNQTLILSGGDDSALITTSVSLNPTSTVVGPKPAEESYLPPTFEAHSTTQAPQNASPPRSPSLLSSTPIHFWTDRKSHTAGIVSILPLSPQLPTTTTTTTTSSSSALPILTGSYDEHIRLFLLDTTSPTLKRSLVLEQKLGGGVWRLKLMHDHYSHTTTTNNTTHYTALVIASCMHGGVRILRLTHTPLQQGWHMAVVGRFTKGHESMNYGSDFRVERDEDGKRTGEYTIVSTSFYDRVVCVWRFVVAEDESGLTKSRA